MVVGDAAHRPRDLTDSLAGAMLAFFSPDARHAARAHAAFPCGTRLAVAADWSTFEQYAAGADCAVICLEWLSADADFSRLLELRARLPLQPLVLLTRKDADNARSLKDISIDEVVWHEEMARELWPAVSRAQARGVLSRIALRFQEADVLALPLRRGIVFACRSPRPIYGVSALASAAGCDRRTLWRYWRAAVGTQTILSLQDVLDWLLLLRAAGRKTADVGWHAVAEELGVHEHTIARLAQRLTDRTLRELTAPGTAGVVAEFEARVLVSLTPRSERA